MSGADTFNTAGVNSFVGVQAGRIHDSTIYVVGPDDPPELEYQAGVNYLEHGVPDKARDHIERALNRGHDSSEVRFHLVLALLSKRSYRDLDKLNRETLRALTGKHSPVVGDEWRAALGVVLALVACVDGSGGDPDTAVSRLRALPVPQRDLVLRHLGLVLTGSMKQGLWKKYLDTAHKDRTADERFKRVWAYFEPEPEPARAGHPHPKRTSGWDVFGGLLLAAAVMFPFAILVRSAFGHGSMSALLPCLAVLVFVPTACWHVALWHHKRQRVLNALKEHNPRSAKTSPPVGGFTDRVERTFDHYFAKYAPEPEKRAMWLAEMQGIRRSLRDEVAHAYRESDVRSGQVNWLIRFMVRDVRRRWLEGQPLRPQDIHRLDTATKVRCVALCVLSAVAAASVIGAAFQHAPLGTVGCVLLAGLASRFAIPLWSKLYSERRRYGEESLERSDKLTARRDEYERWRNKLDALMPTESEMEKWLEADKTVILDEALQYYRLHWHEVIAHAFLPTPGRPCKKARVEGGPWRYSKYVIRIFLITNEGVRETSTDLDFGVGVRQISERDNYRFDAISSVQVEMSGEHHYTLNITLTNGPTKSLVVSGAPTDQPVNEGELKEMARIDLEAAGFPHTLRILEGIAAEGKPWFNRESDVSPPNESDPPAAA